MLLWLLCRESYAETLRQQEEKRKQRMEMERRYEQQYYKRQLIESKCIEFCAPMHVLTNC